MTPFAIFTIVLTVLYVLYYAAITAMDILVNPNVPKTTEEVIEVDADDEVPSVVVVDPDDTTDEAPVRGQARCHSPAGAPWIFDMSGISV